MDAPVSPCLWFDGQAEEAARFYTAAFPDTTLGPILRWQKDSETARRGDVLTIDVVIRGVPFCCLNGGAHFKPTPGISFFFLCDTQAELDAIWEKLLDGGQTMACGWITDRFGITWQIVPRHLRTWIADPDPAAARRTMDAMMSMTKFDIAALERAHRGG